MNYWKKVGVIFITLFVLTGVTNCYTEEPARGYDWFDETATFLSVRQGEVRVHNLRIAAMIDGYNELGRPAWSQGDLDLMERWKEEKLRLISSYNILAAEYNLQMSKVTEDYPLPRRFAIYEVDVKGV